MVTVNLEQFREAVEQWKMLAQVGEVVEAIPVKFGKKPEEYTARIAEADRLLSIIDSAGKAESMADETGRTGVACTNVSSPRATGCGSYGAMAAGGGPRFLSMFPNY